MNEKNTQRLKGRHILLVEDEGLIALDLQQVLEGWGCSVMGPVANANAALSLIAEYWPDAAILDININSGTSEPVGEALRLGGCPFVLLTAYQTVDVSGAFKGAPLLRKPLNEQSLQKALGSLFA